MNNRAVNHFSDADFESEVLNSDMPVLVDFWAEWCMPCRIVGPTIEALAQEYQGKIKIGKLNVDQNPVIPTKYGINGIPSLLLYKNGKVVDSVVGVAPKEWIANMLEKNLENFN